MTVSFVFKSRLVVMAAERPWCGRRRSIRRMTARSLVTRCHEHVCNLCRSQSQTVHCCADDYKERLLAQRAAGRLR
jgi:hypothetical protein